MIQDTKLIEARNQAVKRALDEIYRVYEVDEAPRVTNILRRVFAAGVKAADGK